MSTEMTVSKDRGLSIQSFDDLMSRAKFLADSKIIPSGLQGKPADVAVILMQGAELEIGPMQAIQGINVIQGKPSVSPELQLAMIRSKVPEAVISVKSEVTQKGPKVTVTMAPSKERMDEAFTTVWDMDRATRMGLAGKDNYLKQPEVMLKWRAVGEAARTVFPHITRGLKNSVEAEFEESDDGDKASRLAGLNQKPELKVVQAEVTESPQPEVEKFVKEVYAPAEVYDPVADYVIPVGATMKGKKLKETDPETLRKLIQTIRQKETATKTPLTGEWLEFVMRAEEFLGRQTA